MKNLVIICLSIFVFSALAEQSENAEEEFIATNEWQTVKEGQRIPPGLHIRLNLQTGLREAKLLDKETSSNQVIPVSSDTAQEEISRQNLEQAFANLDLSKDDVPTDQTHDDEVRQKYRSYDELKKEFESLNMKIQTDQEILTDLIEQLNTTNDHGNLKTILTDLEYYLHQYDNAILFADLNGLDLLMQLLNSTESNTDIRLLTCLTFGAAFQGNSQVQRKATSLGFIQYFLRLLNTESNEMIIHRLLFALSTLLRNFPPAQESFLEHGGPESMVKILDQPNLSNKIIVRALTFMNDLILEKDQIHENKHEAYANIDLRKQLIDHGWCRRLSTRLNTYHLQDEFDFIDKTITAMISFIDRCQRDFLPLMTTLDKLNTIYTNSDLSSTDILQNIEILRRKLQIRSSDDL